MDIDLSFLGAFPAASDYLSAMYLIQRDHGSITNQQLAQVLKISTSAVSQATGRLKKLELVSQERYGTLHLTGQGRQCAMTILKRHYLLEHLLVRKTGYPWFKADAEAQVLQNHISADLAEHLDRILDHPQTCPHGNPLPGSPDEARILAAPRLLELPAGSSTCTVTILRITETGEALPDMLPFCESHAIMPGARFTVEKKGDNRLLIPVVPGTPHTFHPQGTIQTGQPFTIPDELAAHIGVQPD